MELNDAGCYVDLIHDDGRPAAEHPDVILLIKLKRFLIPLTCFPGVVVRENGSDGPDALRVRGSEGLPRQLVVAPHGLAVRHGGNSR